MLNSVLKAKLNLTATQQCRSSSKWGVTVVGQGISKEGRGGLAGAAQLASCYLSNTGHPCTNCWQAAVISALHR